MVHLGNNISKLRGFRRLGQKEVAAKLDILQQEYSRLEKKQVIDDEMLARIAAAIDFPVELIKTMQESGIVQNVYQNEGNNGNGFYINNPVEIIIELYNKLLKEKDEIIEMYKKLQKD